MHPDLPENNPLKLTAEEMKSMKKPARHLDPKNKAKRTLQLAVQSVRDRKAGITWSGTGHTDAPSHHGIRPTQKIQGLQRQHRHR